MKHAIQQLKTQVTSVTALQPGRELLARIVECSSNAIFSVAEGRIPSWNQGAERLYGYTAEEALDKEFIGLLWPEITAGEKTRLSLCFTQEADIADFETFHVGKGGMEVSVDLVFS